MMNNVILASSDKIRTSHWKQGLNGFATTTFTISNETLDTFWNDVVRIRPDVLLLDSDLLMLNGTLQTRNLSKICAETKVIVLASEISEDVEWALLKAGVRGCCPSDTKQQDIKAVVLAVQQGELWIRRRLTSRLVDELGKITSKHKAYRNQFRILNHLTQREFDIALRVCKGESNKQIAEACTITERTVKAHLTEIFQKIGVTDRLNLALFMSADSRNGLANLESSLH
jgi:DNA-binding NarL/FixJ family response regulator